MFITYALMGLLGFGVADLFASYLSKSTGHIKGMLWNTIFMLPFLIILSIITTSKFDFLLLSPTITISILIAAIFQTLGGLSFYKGTQVGSLSILSPISASYSLIIVLLSLLFLNETLSNISVFAIVLIIFGTVLISTNLKELKNLKVVATDKSVPYAIASMLLWGIGLTSLSFTTKQLGWLPANLYTTLVSTIFLIGIALVKERNLLPTKSKSYILAAILGFFSTMGYLGYSLGAQYGLSSIVGPVVAAAPLVTVTLALIFLKDKLTKAQIVGILLIISGVVTLAI